ncbi:hypothetical protein KRM28CT15_38490 [Krasilnikovia sp. M28-CT-15]
MYAAHVSVSDISTSGLVDAGSVTVSGTYACPPRLSEIFNRYEPGVKRPSTRKAMLAVHGACGLRVAGSVTAAR